MDLGVKCRVCGKVISRESKTYVDFNEACPSCGDPYITEERKERKSLKIRQAEDLELERKGREEKGLCPKCGGNNYEKVLTSGKHGHDFYKKCNVCAELYELYTPEEKARAKADEIRRRNSEAERLERQRLRDKERQAENNEWTKYRERVEKGLCTRCGSNDYSVECNYGTQGLDFHKKCKACNNIYKMPELEQQYRRRMAEESARSGGELLEAQRLRDEERRFENEIQAIREESY